jgi:hypothetical protein
VNVKFWESNGGAAIVLEEAAFDRRAPHGPGYMRRRRLKPRNPTPSARRLNIEPKSGSSMIARP